MLRALQKFFMTVHTTVYRASKGRVFGGFRNARFLLLHTTGRKSGQDRVTPLNYVADGDAFVLIASNGGNAKHPDWYFNIKAKPEAEVEWQGQRFPVTVTVAEGEERARLWKLAIETWPAYANYEKKTDRTIPVVRLERVSTRTGPAT